jgi:hypothetical protein
MPVRGLDERRTPLRVLHIEIEVVDGDRLAAEVEEDTSGVGHHFAGFEGRRLFLSDAYGRQRRR